MSDDFEQKGQDVDEQNDVSDEQPQAPDEPRHEWPLREWERRPASEEPGYGEPAREEPAREPYTYRVLESRYPPRRPRDPLARLFPGLPRGVRVTLDWILTIAGAILIVLALKQWVVNPYRIPSSSMEPTLNCAKGLLSPGCLGNSSDRVLACRICLRFRSPSRGDIVVFNTPSEAAAKCGEGGTFVKRVIGLPGDTIREDKSGFIWIRGLDSRTFVKLEEPYLTAQRRLADGTHFGQMWHVPMGQYFMMGDNRPESCDSRSWGAVPRNKLIGTVFFVYWPPDRISFR